MLCIFEDERAVGLWTGVLKSIDKTHIITQMNKDKHNKDTHGNTWETKCVIEVVIMSIVKM